jgi:glycosyltransferase involved in cell wall biosynthesis
MELTILMPCLNEADTVEVCIAKSLVFLRGAGVQGEVVVADNGSTDGSQVLAMKAGARVVAVAERGYGAALMAGIEAARGDYVIMGDADDSYDFRDLGKFLEQLRGGHEVVQGCRLPWGGGTVLPGAMPFLHRWWGNPMFTLLARWWFHAPIHDIYCGLRGFRRDWQLNLGQRCTGMEFATEMLIKASLTNARIAEVPITLHPDGRKAHAPHLKTFRDGWRTLRFFLLCTPRWLFLVPGFALFALGLLGYALALPGVTLRGATLDAHTLLFASLALLCGYQAAVFAVFTKTLAQREGLLPPAPRLARFFEIATLERGLVLSALAMLVGSTLLLLAMNRWRLADFGALEYSATMRLVIPGTTVFALGFQTVLSSFLLSMLGIARR